MKQVHLKIFGHVQGVFFRAHALEKAQEHGIRGWVRNLPDQTVEIVAQGEDEALNTFIEWCKHGPPVAEVTNVVIYWEDISEPFSDFEIR